jgi:hypothetical protein
MALSSACVWEIRSTATANNANGGFFKAGATGTDYSQQDAAQWNLTGLSSAGAGAVIPTVSAAATMVGNGLHVISGTNATVGWYEIISVVVGVSITVDRNWCTGVVASGVINIGGALSLNSATANQTDTNVAATFVAGNTVWFKGALTLAANFTTTNGTALLPITLKGYASSRGDNPTGATRPTINCAAFIFYATVRNMVMYLSLTGTGTNVYQQGVGTYGRYLKVVNTSTTANRGAMAGITNANYCMQCEFVSYRGYAVNQPLGVIAFCYIHDSSIGIVGSASAGNTIIVNNLITSCVTSAISLATSGTGINSVYNNTLHGCSNKLGTGISLATGANVTDIYNNIITGFVTGISHADATNLTVADFNDFFNNTTNRTNIAVGAGDITLDPAFTNVGQITGATATTSGSVLTQSGADFSAVVDGQDFCNIKSGTGVTAGVYGITSHTGTTLTLDIAPGTSAVADKVFQITTGRNFAVGSNMAGVGFPGTFPAGLTTGYMDIGAFQRQAAVGGSGGSFTFVT